MEDSLKIEWTLDMLKRFKARYKRAVQNSEDVFVFDKHEFLTAYAKYLIEWLEGQFHG